MTEEIHNPEKNACHLKKLIYGLKQAIIEWSAKLLYELKCQGYVQSRITILYSQRGLVLILQ